MNKLPLGILSTILVAGLIGGAVWATTPASAKLIFISGTEYKQNEAGQTIVRVTTSLGIPISDVNYCQNYVYFPNKTIWVNNVSMVQGGTDGSWYDEWTTPNVTGNYEEYVECSVGASGRLVGAGSSFHVSETLTELADALGLPVARIIS
jgi:hypothetical protein